jgi:hypothetical protein
LLVDRSQIEIMKKNIILNVESLERSKIKGKKK